MDDETICSQDGSPSQWIVGLEYLHPFVCVCILLALKATVTQRKIQATSSLYLLQFNCLFAQLFSSLHVILFPLLYSTALVFWREVGLLVVVHLLGMQPMGLHARPFKLPAHSLCPRPCIAIISSTAFLCHAVKRRNFAPSN